MRHVFDNRKTWNIKYFKFDVLSTCIIHEFGKNDKIPGNICKVNLPLFLMELTAYNKEGGIFSLNSTALYTTEHNVHVLLYTSFI